MRINALSLPALSFVLVFPAARVAGQSPPDISGLWTINHSLSDDPEAKVAEVAGPDAVAGARTFGGQVFFPRASYGADVDRVNLRKFLLTVVASLERLEIEQTPDEVKTIFGDEVRIFNLKRASTGSNAAGVKLTRRTRWQGEQLILESESGKTKLIEVLSLVPTRAQLIHAVRYEADVFKKPLDLKLVYDRAPKGGS